MSQFEVEEDLSDLSSAEEFLSYFDIPFEQSVVHINRLHIMQRYHDYLNKAENAISDLATEEEAASVYKMLLERAYLDFVDSDAQTEKVFKVFKMQEPQQSFVSLEQILGA